MTCTKATYCSDASIDSYSGKIIFSTDNGTTWSDLHDFGHPVYWVATDPTNANRLYASVVNYGSNAGGIWVCNDLNNGSSSTWSKLSSPPRTEGHPASITVLNNGDVLCSFSGRRTNVFTTSSGVFLLDHNTNTWSDRTDPMMEYYTKDVVVDSYDATQQTWYAGVFSGWGGTGNNDGGLYKTTNAGTTWTRIFSGSDVPSCTFSPVNHDEIYIATSGNGLWHCDNINAAAPTITQVSSYKFANPERIFFNPYNNEELWIATFGYGMNFGETNVGIAEENFSSEINLFPNPTSNQIKIELNLPASSDLHLHFLNSLGEIVLKKSFENISNHFSASLAVSDLPAGIYLMKVIFKENILTRKVVIGR